MAEGLGTKKEQLFLHVFKKRQKVGPAEGRVGVSGRAQPRRAAGRGGDRVALMRSVSQT